MDLIKGYDYYLLKFACRYFFRRDFHKLLISGSLIPVLLSNVEEPGEF